MRICFILFLVFFSFYTISSQNNIGIGTTNPDPTAALDIESTDKGVLVPRVSTSQRLLIGGGNPATGLLVYDIDKKSFYFFDGTNWIDLSVGSPDTDWTETPSEVYTTKNVGIGNNNPDQLLEVGNINSTSNYIRVSSINNRANGIEFVRTGSSNDWRWQNSNSFFDLYKVTNDFTSAGLEDILATFSAQGRLGIGNNDPQSELHVEGGIRASDLEGSGNRPVYADPNGELVLTAPSPSIKYWSNSGYDFYSNHPNFVYGGSSYISSASGFQPGIFAPVHLPDGAVLSSIIFYYQDSDPINEINVRLRRVSLGSIQTVISFQSSGIPGSFVSTSPLPVSEVVDNNTYSYVIEVFPSSDWTADLRIRGVRISYTPSN